MADSPYAAFGRFLTSRMDAAGLTRAALVDRLKAGDATVAYQQVYAWCAGEYRPRADKFAALAAALGCRVEDVAMAAAGIEAAPATTPPTPEAA